MLRTKKILALVLATLLLVSSAPAIRTAAAEISPTYAVTWDKDGTQKDGTVIADGFELWTITTAGTAKGNVSEVEVKGNNVVMPTSFTRNGTPGAATAVTPGLTENDEVNFLTISDAARGTRVVDSIELTVNAGNGALVRPYGLVVGFYEENGYIVGVGFNGIGQMFPAVNTKSHSLYLDNNAGNVFGNGAAFFNGTETTYNNNDRIDKDINVTYKFTYVYTGEQVTAIKWEASAARVDGSDTPFYYGANTAVKTQYTKPLTGTFNISSGIENSSKWLNHSNFTNVPDYNKQATLTWNSTNCVPVVISGDQESRATFVSVKYNVKKTQEELDAEAAEQIPAEVNAAYEKFADDKSMETADAFFAAYNQLTEGLLSNHQTQVDAVNAWLKERYVSNGQLKYSPAELENYPSVKTWVESENYNNVFDGSLVQSATAVFDKATLNASSKKELIFLNDTTAGKNGQGAQVSINGFSISVYEQSDGRYQHKALIPDNNIGDVKTVGSDSTWEIAKTTNTYGKLDWHSAFKAPESAGSDRLVWNFVDAGKTEAADAYTNTQYIAITYTVNYTDVTEKSYTYCNFEFTIWADDNGNGVLDETETVLFTENRMDPNTSLGSLIYNYKDGKARRFAFGGIGENAQQALVSLTLRNDFVAKYEHAYTNPTVDTVLISDIVKMNEDLKTTYPTFTAAVKEQAEAAYALITPMALGATVKISANQNLAFWGGAPTIFATHTADTEIYTQNLESVACFGAIFESYNTMVATDTTSELTHAYYKDQKATTDINKKGYADKLLIALTNIDLKASENWDKWIVARFYVKYTVDDQQIAVYSINEVNNPAGATGINSTGTVIRSVNGVLKSILASVTSNAKPVDTYDHMTAVEVKDATGAAVTTYDNKTFGQAKSVLDEKFDTAVDACYFLIAYQNVVNAISPKP